MNVVRALRPFAVLLFTLASIGPAPTWAAIIVDVNADGSVLQHAQADNSVSPNPPEKSVHGRAAATGFSAGASVSPGPAGGCDLFPFVNTPGCFIQLPGAHAVGEIRGDLGRLRAGGLAVGEASSDFLTEVRGPTAIATLTLIDGLVMTSTSALTFNFHVEGDVTTGPNGVTRAATLEFHAKVNGLPVADFVGERTENNPGSEHVIFDQTFVTDVFASGIGVFLEVEMEVQVDCALGVDTVCSANGDATGTGFIGVRGDFVSASGFSYPGFVPDGPGPGPVPLPSSLALVIAGGLVVARLRARR